MVVFGQSDCILAKVFVFGKVVCIGAKVLYSGKSCCILAKVVVFEMSGFNRDNLLYASKKVVIGQK